MARKLKWQELNAQRHSLILSLMQAVRRTVRMTQ